MTELLPSKPEESFLSRNFDLLCELDLEWLVQAREFSFHQKRDLRKYWLMQERGHLSELQYSEDIIWNLGGQNFCNKTCQCIPQHVRNSISSMLHGPRHGREVLAEASVPLWRICKGWMESVLGHLGLWDHVFDSSSQIGAGLNSKTWCPVIT